MKNSSSGKTTSIAHLVSVRCINLKASYTENYKPSADPLICQINKKLSGGSLYRALIRRNRHWTRFRRISQIMFFLIERIWRSVGGFWFSVYNNYFTSFFCNYTYTLSYTTHTIQTYTFWFPSKKEIDKRTRTDGH